MSRFLFGECFSGDTIVFSQDGKVLSVQELAGMNLEFCRIMAWNSVGEYMFYDDVARVRPNGVRAAMRLTLDSGNVLEAGENVRVFTNRGFKLLKDLNPEWDEVGVRVRSSGWTGIGFLPNYADTWSLGFKKIVSVESIGDKFLFDVEVEAPGTNFVADGIVVASSLD